MASQVRYFVVVEQCKDDAERDNGQTGAQSQQNFGEVHVHVANSIERVQGTHLDNKSSGESERVKCDSVNEQEGTTRKERANPKFVSGMIPRIPIPPSIFTYFKCCCSCR